MLIVDSFKMGTRACGITIIATKKHKDASVNYLWAPISNLKTEFTPFKELPSGYIELLKELGLIKRP